ncbi:MAG: hypothetical protein ACRET8_00190 [Burkholderiales bacterium]
MKSRIIPAVLAMTAFSCAFAQSPKPAAVGGTVVASEPGKAAMVSAAEVVATIVGIEKSTRTVTLKGPDGKSADVVAGDEVKNFDQIRIGDKVRVKYLEALSLELRKVRSHEAPSGSAAAVAAVPGARPAGAVGAEVRALADVVRVDPKKSIISLKGPRGNVIDLHVRNPDQFKVVKKGDQVEVVYTQAIALSVEPAAGPAKKK